MTFRSTFEAKKGVSEAGNTVETLNQQVQGSIPWRLTLDTESPSVYYSNDFPVFYYPSSSFLQHSATDKLVS